MCVTTKHGIYPKDLRTGKAIVGWFTLLLIILVLISLLRYPPDSLWGYGYVLLPTLLFVLAYAYFANFWPAIEICEQGLRVEFFWFRLFVGWEQVVSIKRSPSQWRLKTWVVKTRALTPFHRLYGLLNGLAIAPCFLIHSNLENCHEIVEQIKERATG